MSAHEEATAAPSSATATAMEDATDARQQPAPESPPATPLSLKQLMQQQRESLSGEEIVTARDYLALAKPVKAADGTSPLARSRPGTSQSPSRPPTAGAAVVVASGSAEATEGQPNETVEIRPYNPGTQNRHLHIRDTLTLALRVLEVNKRDGGELLPDEQHLVNAIAAFATAPVVPSPTAP